MTVNSIGDQARAFVLKAATAQLKTTLDVLTQEVSSGEVADLGMRLQGNSRTLNAIEARMKMLDQYQRNAAEAASVTGTMQDVLGAIHASTSQLALAIQTEPSAPTSQTLMVRADEISQAFSATVQGLNTEIAGRHLFSGLATDHSPLISADEILDHLGVATAGLSTAQDIAAAVSDWFDAPAASGFLGLAYLGTSGGVRQIEVAEGHAIGVATTAADPAIREVMKGLATAALVSRGVLAGDDSAQRQLMATGAQILIRNESSLLSATARIGLQQKIVADSQTTNASALSVLTIARNDLRQADPYQTSVALTHTQNQLDALYTVTARLSKLQLVEYLR